MPTDKPSARIVTVFNQKGGCGKTNTSMQLAGAIAASGLRVAVIDMDPQNTATLWNLQAPEEDQFPAMTISLAPLKEAFVGKIEAIAAKHDLLIIDCPPAIDSRVPWVALNIADLAIIPVVPVMDNIWASKQAEELAIEAQKARKNLGEGDELKAVYLLNMIRRGNVYDSCLATLQKDARLPIMKARVSLLNAYSESQLFGCSVKKVGNGKASKEIDAVASEVCKTLKLKFNATNIKG